MRLIRTFCGPVVSVELSCDRARNHDIDHRCYVPVRVVTRMICECTGSTHHIIIHVVIEIPPVDVETVASGPSTSCECRRGSRGLAGVLPEGSEKLRHVETRRARDLRFLELWRARLVCRDLTRTKSSSPAPLPLPNWTSAFSVKPPALYLSTPPPERIATTSAASTC